MPYARKVDEFANIVDLTHSNILYLKYAADSTLPFLVSIGQTALQIGDCASRIQLDIRIRPTMHLAMVVVSALIRSQRSVWISWMNRIEMDRCQV